MSNQRQTPLSYIRSNINARITLVEQQRDEYQSNPSLTPQAKDAAANYYRGSLKELSRLRAIIGAA